MGLVSFLTRRNAADRPAQSATSGHPAYNTSAASSPVRGAAAPRRHQDSCRLTRSRRRPRNWPGFLRPAATGSRPQKEPAPAFVPGQALIPRHPRRRPPRHCHGRRPGRPAAPRLPVPRRVPRRPRQTRRARRPLRRRLQDRRRASAPAPAPGPRQPLRRSPRRPERGQAIRLQVAHPGRRHARLRRGRRRAQHEARRRPAAEPALGARAQVQSLRRHHARLRRTGRAAAKRGPQA